MGTLYEIFAVLALKRKAEIIDSKPFILLDGYFNKLEHVLDNMVTEGFIGTNLKKYYSLAATPGEAVSLLKKANL